MTPFLRREIRTLERMIRIFCRGRHGAGASLCPDCARLLRYGRARLEACSFGEAKPVCSRCPRHCYAPRYRRDIRRVMAYAGPRMLLRHPADALRHLRGMLRKRG